MHAFKADYTRLIRLMLLISLLVWSPQLYAASTALKTNFVYTVTGLEKDKKLMANVNERMKIFLGNTQYNNHAADMAFRGGKKEIKKALEPFGYFRATVSGSLTRQKNQWLAAYQVNPGVAIRFTRFKVLLIGEGKQNPALRAELKTLPIGQSDILRVTRYQKMKISLINLAQSQGYINARYTTDDVTVNLVHYQATLLLVLDTGPRYYFGPINFSKTPLNTDFLRRFLNFKEGQPFNANTLSDLQDIYASTGYFRSATITPNIPDADSQQRSIPIDANLDMNKKHLYQIGLGYGTVTGIRVTGNINWRWVNARGDKLKIGGIWSSNYYDINGQYLIPAKNPVTSYYTLNGALYLLLPVNKGKAEVAKAGPGYLWQKNRWTLQTRLYFLYEKWRVTNTTPHFYSHLLMPRFDAQWISTDDPVRVENGAKMTFVLSGAWKSLLSTATYVQPQFNFTGIKTLGKNNRFILNVQTGMNIGGDYLNVPLSEQFYAGGPNSILGFDYLGIGPGRYLTVGNVAYQRRIYKEIYGGVFYNVGNAFNDFNRYTHNLNRTAGLSLIWRTPVGALTVYWARILSKPGQPNQFGFSLGPEL